MIWPRRRDLAMIFTVSRVVKAPIARVWQAWTTATDLERWYSPGPTHWRVEHLDVRPGGTYRMTMETPDGEHVSEGGYSVVEAPTRLVQGPADGSMTIDTTLEPQGGATKMVVCMEGLPADQHDMMDGAWNAGFDKLEQLLKA